MPLKTGKPVKQAVAIAYSEKRRQPKETTMKMSKTSMRMEKQWEGSKADKKSDKKGAKKHGMSMKEWEGSDIDKRMDKMHAKKMAEKKRKAK